MRSYQFILFKNLLLLAGVLAAFSACTSLKQTQYNGIKKVTAASAFNGTYQYTYFTYHYAPIKDRNNTDKKKAIDSIANTDLITIAAINNKRLHIQQCVNGDSCNTTIIKGKLKKNYFVSRHKRKIIPIPFVFGLMKNYQVQFSINNNDELNQDVLDNKWGWFLFFVAANNNQYVKAYKRIEQQK